ncbi:MULTISPECIES: signal recognition particle-docking protein FtsY [Carboxydothermus]|uniref:Signal recognition particle receptor FtsY n=2 Tax=Carboxydothermus TaxID=129957 RepID=Q3AC60_CARHZ|nr:MULTISPECIES: signal recognition particle-docking protein FtsY [Carboxydothermus]ABB14135.1 signal recognition particle-docking protein FtsY [Carboxydothermus hydrogenoformans Z-2901]NYE58211.1 fused signal recognition particle receptor [Carboxydothermus ferrireducens DSM 11255]
MGFFDRLKESLIKTKQNIVAKIEDVFKKSTVDEELFEKLEEILIEGDVGVKPSLELVEKLRKTARERRITDSEQLKQVLKEEILKILEAGDNKLKNVPRTPLVILVVGVNGVGKTTTIGKLAYYFKQQGKQVLLAAGDTFRAAAIEQLEIWGNKVGCPVIKQKEGSDPAAVAFDAVKAAIARKIDVLIIDTAGRLHTKTNLMEELRKVKRVIERELPGAPDEVLLVLDATTGQNALSQVEYFNKALDLTGLVLTKLDGTAKGGVIIGIKSSYQIPIKFIGVGEKMDDLRPFDPQEFVEALFSS